MSWNSDINVYLDNPYYKIDQIKFEIILNLVNQSGRWIGKKLTSKPDLIAYINKCLPLLDDSCYNIVTKLIWIFTGRTEFPVCPICRKKFGERINIKLPRMYNSTCSEKCARKMRSKSNVKTCIDRYGVSNVFQLESVKNKACDTKEFKYGDRFYTNLNARSATNIKKYGVENNMQSEIGLTEYCMSIQNKYGVDFPMQSPVCIKHYRDTCIERYGRPDVSTPETVQKRKNTCKKLYGVETPMQSHSIRAISQKRYLYNGKQFDSSPELAIYIWCIDHNISFECQPDIFFEYTYNGEIHKYFPDFMVDGEIVEIKGNQFVKSDGTWQNPYNHAEDELYETKHQCCVKNKVHILYESEYYKYVKYCEIKFRNKKWYKQFKN